jgi:perosamine synthetase
MSKEILFYKPTINETQKKLVNEVLAPDSQFDCKVRVLEEAMIDVTGATYAVATNNATAAMHLSLCAIDLKRGDKVLCSVNAFPSVPEVVRHFDAEPVFIDIDKDTYNMDLNVLEKYLDENNSKKLKAVIITHIAGQPTDLDRLYEMGQKYSVQIIEDATDAMGASYKGQPIGSTGGNITIFSFSPHLKHEGARGGVMVCEDEKIFERAKLLLNHAIPTDEENENQLAYIYDVVDIGCEYGMSELDAAYCLGALENVTSATQRCQEIAAKYMKALDGVKHISLPVTGDDHAFNLFIIKIDKNRDSFARDLEEKGIYTGLHFIPLHLISYYKAKYELRVNAYPVALQTYQQILSLPIYEALTDAEVDYICDTIIDLAKDRN